MDEEEELKNRQKDELTEDETLELYTIFEEIEEDESEIIDDDESVFLLEDDL